MLRCSLVLLLAIAAPIHAESPAPAPGKPVSVRLKWLHQVQFSGMYLAVDEGLYRDQGLDVTLQAGGLEFPSVQMVASGSDQFGLTGSDQFLLARSKGVPILALAILIRRNPMTFFHRKTAGMKGPKGWEGHKVGVKLGGTEELNYRAVLKAAGVDESRIEEVPVKYDMALFFSGAVDVWPGYAINEPILARQKNIEVEEIRASDHGVDLPTDVLFASEDQISRDPDIARRFVQATVQGWERVFKDSKKAVDATISRSPKLDREHQTQSLAALIPLVKPDARPVGFMETSQWERVQTILLNQGRLKQPVDLRSAFTTRFLEGTSGPK